MVYRQILIVKWINYICIVFFCRQKYKNLIRRQDWAGKLYAPLRFCTSCKALWRSGNNPYSFHLPTYLCIQSKLSASSLSGISLFLSVCVCVCVFVCVLVAVETFKLVLSLRVVGFGNATEGSVLLKLAFHALRFEQTWISHDFILGQCQCQQIAPIYSFVAAATLRALDWHDLKNCAWRVASGTTTALERLNKDVLWIASVYSVFNGYWREPVEHLCIGTVAQRRLCCFRRQTLSMASTQSRKQAPQQCT